MITGRHGESRLFSAGSTLLGIGQDYLANLGLTSPRNLSLTGQFGSWEEAMRSCTGYDDGFILEKTKTALLKVKNGEAVYERDSVLFDQVQYSWELLASLMWTAARAGRLHVLDFGGSLGSSYYQNRKFLDTLPDVRWNVVEQPKHVEVGVDLFSTDTLRFYYSIDDCIRENRINLVLLSGVLQYLENPSEILKRLMAIPDAVIIIDRTPFYTGDSDRLFLQTVPPSIYPATYPCWVFSRQRFGVTVQEGNRDVLVEYEALDHIRNPVQARWYGMILAPQ
jgi:putative methyltransferase (TIGR04325 family)